MLQVTSSQYQLDEHRVDQGVDNFSEIYFLKEVNIYFKSNILENIFYSGKLSFLK